MFLAGSSAAISEPELYWNTSVMSPVASRVLTMLSPSVPWARVSSFTVTPVFLALNASISACSGLTVWSELSASTVMVVAPAAPPAAVLLVPSEPAEQADNSREPTARPVIRALRPCFGIDTSLYLLVGAATVVVDRNGLWSCVTAQRAVVRGPRGSGAALERRAITLGASTSWADWVRPAIRSSNNRTAITPIWVPDWLTLVSDIIGWAATSVSS